MLSCAECQFNDSGNGSKSQYARNSLTKELFFLSTQSVFEIVGGSRREILGFHWIQHFTCDCVLIHTTGLDFYRLEDMRLRHVKYIKQQLSHYWVEANTGTVVLACVQRPTELLTCFLQDQSGQFIGQAFEPEHGQSDHLGWTTRQRTSGELTESLGSEKDDYKAAIAVVYDQVLFLYFSTAAGRVSLYHLEQTKVSKLPFVLDTCPGVSDLRCIDNLLIVSSLSRQSSAIFDLSCHQPTESLCLTAHCQSPNLPEVMGVPDPESIDLLEMFVSVASVNSFFQLSPSQITVDQDLLIDIKEGVAYMLGVRLEAIARTMNAPIDAVDFLMRRKHCGELAAGYIYEEIKHRSSLTSISSLLAVFVSHFADPHCDSKALQEDMLRCLFQPMWQGQFTTVEIDYLTAISLEYHRLVLEQEQDISDELQILLLERLITNHCIDVVVSLLHRCVFSTTLPIALHLLDTDCPLFRSFGLDMLWRLDETETLIQVLLRQNMKFEAELLANSASFLFLPQANVSLPS